MNIPQDALIQKAYSQLSNEDRMIFESTYKRKAKSVAGAYACWFFFGWQYAYFGQWGTQFLYWFTGGGLLIWHFVDLFRIPGMVDDLNKDVALYALQQVKLHADPQALNVPMVMQARGQQLPEVIER